MSSENRREQRRQAHLVVELRWHRDWLDAHRMMKWGVAPNQIVKQLQFMLDRDCTLWCGTCRAEPGEPCRTIKLDRVTSPHRARASL